eukprot:TRINITY_DN28702_c0_g1_i1.p1 TRINITY_DN28702_c0_g1~~TRINITY_DN28702_c0_g1_i1.p1  ORF type:complete len:185 (-),score=21.78 TRINITY_DN28702_c0_g1_i1:191-745(-)
MDFTFYPFGNQYFAIEACGGGHAYDPVARKCFNDKCGLDATSPRPRDCFTAPLVCQHGERECEINRWFACATTEHTNYMDYMPFVHCMENGYDTGDATSLARECANAASLSFAPLQKCYDGHDGDKATIMYASETPAHGGVPYVLVNNEEVEVASQPKDVLIKAVCRAFAGAKIPKACVRIDYV